ncbi:MAG: retroviral-like aspartic protease family protein, partial [Chloroflexota bacterium]|nr:retroviral-like aspartic protease family protein [Chloroflexota bacterium]
AFRLGTFQVEIEIGGAAAENWIPVSALVDTGATMTAVPSSVLRRLGVEPTTRKAFQFARGEVRTMDVGYARVRVEDQEILTQVLFNDEGTPTLLGAIALENTFLGVDPLAQRLIPIHGVMMSLAPSPITSAR